MADLTQFDVRSAARIARTVQVVEGATPPAKPLTFEAIQPFRKPFRICTYTGSWGIATQKTVTFKNQPNTPNTVSATNLFWPSIPDLGTRDCAIAKDGTAWYLIQVQWNAADVFTSATLTDTALTFGTDKSYTLGTAATVSISVTTCSTAAT